MQYKTQNGYTKAKMIEMIKLGNTNTVSDSLDSLGFGRCLYRGPDNNKCAAGCFIKDSDYDSKFEGISIWRLMTDYKFINDSMPLEAEGMVKMQKIHDTSDDGQVHDNLIAFINLFVTE